MAIKLGEYGENGVVKRRATECAVTGKPLGVGDAFIRIPKTNYFYGVKATVYREMKPEAKEELAERALKAASTKESASPTTKTTEGKDK